MPSITVHHLDRSRSSRILWLLEELEVDYELVEHARGKDFRAPASLREVHPLGKAPAVVVDDTVLVESGAILEHLARTLGDGRLGVPTEDDAHQNYSFFLHYAEGSLMPPLLVKLLTGKVREAKLPFFIKPIARGVADKLDATYTNGEIDLHGAFLDQHLQDRTWFAADRLTAADIQMSYPVYALISRGGADRPNLKAWMDRVTARPAFQRAVQKGGPLI